MSSTAAAYPRGFVVLGWDRLAFRATDVQGVAAVQGGTVVMLPGGPLFAAVAPENVLIALTDALDESTARHVHDVNGFPPARVGIPSNHAV